MRLEHVQTSHPALRISTPRIAVPYRGSWKETHSWKAVLSDANHMSCTVFDVRNRRLLSCYLCPRLELPTLADLSGS